MKKCSKCQLPKNIDDFHKSKFNKDGLHHYCKECNSNDKKERYSGNSAYRSKQYLRILTKKYGLNFDQLEIKFKSQNYCCDICKKPLELKNKTTHIDHNHKTNKLRGILCVMCNSGIGYAQENISILQEMILYLEKHK